MSGWTNVTIEPVDELPQIPSSDPTRDPKEVVSEYLEDEWHTDTAGSPRVIQRSSPTTQIGRIYNDSKLTEIAREMAQECEAVNRIVVVYADDTGMSGSAWLFDVERDESTVSVELVDQWDGYEGAMGQDAAGYMADEYGIYGTANQWV